MKTLVLYESKSGSTAKYAEDIAKRVNADVAPLKKFKLKKMKEYDTIVFGGWIRGGNIQGINKFLQHWDSISEKNVLVFACGMSIATKEARQNLIDQNLLDMYHLRFYQFRGSFAFEKLGPLEKFLIKNSVKQLSKDSEDDNTRMIANIIEQPIEFYDTEKVNRVVSVIETLALEAK
ncbi:MAG: flavodoxin domain-containing protein [Bacilli bacterium]|nr:flavodoxin domain-containing protein [Bacilli bacterium]